MRVNLGGHGDPIPLIALPDPNLSGDRPPQLLQLENGVPFLKAEWTSFGYTNYEVWCVGGAGGQGGGVDGVQFLSTQTRPHLSAGDWALWLEWTHLYDDPLGIIYTHWDPTPRPGAPNGQSVRITMEQYYGEQFPNHDPFEVTTYRSPFLIPDKTAVGGGGGGGGVHVVAGLLADLPDSCAVVVGQAGGDIGAGQTIVNGSYTPGTPYVTPLWSPADTRIKQLDNYFADFTIKYPLPHPSFSPPQPGIDGGASSFGGSICQASGGKGGKPGKVWSGPAMIRDGNGGAGGVGAQIAAGGGALTGQDGTWNPSTGIGQGGGGGKGGAAVPSGGVVLATSGGRGSFSFADTSIYGARQPASFWSDPRYTFDPVTGDIASMTLLSTTYPIVPGGGGGVRALRKLYFGSHALGFNPNGLVAIRLTKIV